MENKENLNSSVCTPINAKQTFFYPFQIIISGICYIMNLLRKPSALQLENDTLQEMIESRREELEVKVSKNEELRKLNDSLDANLLALQVEKDRMTKVLAHTARKISEGNKKVAEGKEYLERLEKQLQGTKHENRNLDARFKEEKLLMEKKTSEWKLTMDDQNKENRSLEANLRKERSVIEKQNREIMGLEMGMGQLQAIISGLRSEKEEMERHCSKLEEENRKLKDEMKHSESSESN